MNGSLTVSLPPSGTHALVGTVPHRARLNPSLTVA